VRRERREDESKDSNVTNELNQNDREIILRRLKRIKKPNPKYVNFAYYVDVNIPKNFREAMESVDKDEWKSAMDEKINSFTSLDVYEWIVSPLNTRILPGHWIYTVKENEQGLIDRYKARYVINGNKQKDGIDYDEIYAPVAKQTSIRLLLALSVFEGMHLHQLDVKTAFLYSDLNENIYVRPPDGYSNESREVWRLKKSVYGLKQASRQWNIKLNEFLIKIGFKSLITDHCIYLRRKGDKFSILSIWVDDIIIAAKTSTEIQDIKDSFKSKFEVKDLGELKYCIGWQVYYDKEKRFLKLHQTKHITEDILYKYNFQNSKFVETPIYARTKLHKDMDGPIKEFEDKVSYRSIIGSLMYAMLGTRPDLATSVSLLSRYQSKPYADHWKATKR
jgi:hypothetical protein